MVDLKVLLLSITFCYGMLTLSQTTNFRPFQTERAYRRQFLVRRKWRKVLQKGRKKLWEKEKMLLTCNFSFPTVFSKDFKCRYVKKNRACLGKG